MFCIILIWFEADTPLSDLLFVYLSKLVIYYYYDYFNNFWGILPHTEQKTHLELPVLMEVN